MAAEVELGIGQHAATWSSSAAAHSRSMKISLVPIAVERSCAAAIAAPQAGSSVAVENASIAW